MPPPLLAAEPRAYVGAGAGFGVYDGTESANNITADIDDSSVGGLVYGGASINDRIDLELAYFHGAAVDTKVTTPLGTSVLDATFTGLNPGVNIKHQTDQLTVFGHVGMMFWDAEYDLGNNTSIETDGNDFTFGVGVETEMSNDVSVRGQWRYIDADGLSTSLFFVSIHRYF